MNKRIIENKLPIMIGVVVAVLAASTTVFAQTLLPSNLSETESTNMLTHQVQPQETISFLMVELSYDAYAVVGKFQGKFHIDDNNRIEKNNFQKMTAMNTTEFENQINKILGVKPNSNPELEKNLSPYDRSSNTTP
jgi:hypothetical protein